MNCPSIWAGVSESNGFHWFRVIERFISTAFLTGIGLFLLHRVRVGPAAYSETLNGLVERGITVLPVANVRDGLLAIIDGRIDAFAFNEAILKYLVGTQYPARLRF